MAGSQKGTRGRIRNHWGSRGLLGEDMGNRMMDQQMLIRKVEGGETPEFLFFWGHTAGAGAVGPWVFSQWFEAPFTVEGRRYPTAEHWMMVGKAEVMGDLEIRDRVLEASSPKQAKALGRKVRGYDEARWQAHRMPRVVAGNVHKFGQHPHLEDYLLSTGDAVLVEASPVDRIWGIGLAASDERARDPRRWRGDNLLGFALMEAREQLRK